MRRRPNKQVVSWVDVSNNSAQCQAVVEQRSAQGLCELHSHVAQPSESYDTHAHAGLVHAVVLHGGVGRDAGTEKRRATGVVEGRRQDECKVCVQHDACSVAALGNGAVGITAQRRVVNAM